MAAHGRRQRKQGMYFAKRQSITLTDEKHASNLWALGIQKPNSFLTVGSRLGQAPQSLDSSPSPSAFEEKRSSEQIL
ncbi:hypothetical protein ED733_004548 [Metarhizium rileyi]|uniref:Uncharacterized protein n=1 Tax=Metarhizium rileyi (strain RCEF 4871) TaxID=1649241 RepID=A0A5C6GDX9_METRR|nr:hypothetical protein ED733_004548 [Metarhizium rileyi]